MSPEQSLLLPFDQFAFAELKNKGKQQQLRLVFATHELSLCAHSLRRLETTMQRMELSLFTVLPGNHLSLVADGQAIALEILVSKVEG